MALICGRRSLGAFTAQTGIKVELTTDKKLEDVIGPSMQGGDYPDVIHLATGREAALTEQFIKGQPDRGHHRRAEHDRARREPRR